jgi:hypothetical protein
VVGQKELEEDTTMLATLAYRVVTVLRDEQGIETLEWVAIGGMVIIVAVAVYTGILQGALVGAVTAVGNTISGV